MKNLLIMLILSINISKAQEYFKGTVNIQSKNKEFIDKLFIQSLANQRVIPDATVQRLFSKNKLLKIHQTYEGTKNEYLKQFYTIYFDGDHNEFLNNAKESRKNGDIDSVFQFRKPILNFDPSDAMYGNLPLRNDWLWHLNNIEASAAWDITRGTNTVTIAVVDDGFDTNHPDLSGKININDPRSGVALRNGNGHGTATSVYAAGITNGNGDIASIGFNTNLRGYLSDFGVENAHRASLIDGARIVSISWHYACSFAEVSQQHRDAIAEILNNGTVIVASAGNGNIHCNGGETFPFANTLDSRIIKVTSISSNNNHENSASHYPQIDICAPGNRMGTAINTTNANGSQVSYPYALGWGTSYATPIVAGIVGLMLAANPCLTVNQVSNIIARTALPVSDEAQFSGLLGAGRINAYRAVKEAVTLYIQNTTTPNFTINTSRPFINIGSDVDFRQTLGPVKLVSGTKWTINAREVEIKNDFEVPLGAELTINTSPTQPLGCP